MRYNGKMYCLREQQQSLNAYGEAVGNTEVWSDGIDCHIKTNSDTRKGRYEDGVFRMASFTVLIEPQPFGASRIRLERNGEDLGEYGIISVEPLAVMGRIQIIV